MPCGRTAASAGRPELVPAAFRAVAFGWLAFVRGLGLLLAGAVLGAAHDHTITLVVGIILNANTLALAGLVLVPHRMLRR